MNLEMEYKIGNFNLYYPKILNETVINLKYNEYEFKERDYNYLPN